MFYSRTKWLVHYSGNNCLSIYVGISVCAPQWESVPVHYNGSNCPCTTAVLSARYYIKSGKVPVHCIGAPRPCTTEGRMPLPYSENECSCSTAGVGALALHQLENKCQCTIAGISVHGRGNKRPCTTAGVSARALH